MSILMGGIILCYFHLYTNRTDPNPYHHHFLPPLPQELPLSPPPQRQRTSPQQKEQQPQMLLDRQEML